MTLAPGAHLGVYEVTGLVGEGGMGSVYRARDTRLHRDVALKVARGAQTSDEGARSRVAREAIVLAGLNHPNIATLHGVEHVDGSLILVMELVEGDTLADRLDLARVPSDRSRTPAGRRALPLDAAVEIAAQVVEALAAAHDRGIVHRDLKPANVKIRPDGVVKVLDFGLAKVVGPGQDGALPGAAPVTLTSDSALRGTPAYMSPEQARGRVTDSRTDIWAFGCICFEMLAGTAPFRGPTAADTLAGILEREPDYAALRPDTPSAMVALLRCCLQKDARRRLRDIGDARSYIEDARRERESGRPSRSLRRAIAPARSLPWAVLVVTTIAIAAALMYLRPEVGDGTGPPLSPDAFRLTFDDGLQTEPTLSPDGSSVAYAADTAGNFEIWTQSVAGGTPVRVTQDPAHDWQPDWSPAGTHLAFRSERNGGGLFVIPATGGFASRIADFGYRPQWSPDGTRVLFTQVLIAGVAAPLYVVGLDGGPPRPIFPDATPLSSAFGWYRDERTVMLLRSAAPAFAVDVRTVDVSDGSQRQWMVDPAVARRVSDLELAVTAGDPIPWSANGTDIVFAGVSRGVSGLWRLELDPAGARVAGGPHRLSNIAEAAPVTRSRDGRRFAFAVASAAPQLWSYPLSAGRVDSPRGEPITAAAVSATAPDVTTDGTRLLYVLARPASRQHRELIVRSLVDGTERTVRTIDADREALALARWTRDGRRISYAHLSLAPAMASVRLLDVATGHESDMTTPIPMDATQQAWAAHQVSNWSPGDELLVASGSRYVPGQSAVAVLAAAASPHAEASARVVTSSNDGPLNQPVISPNGRWVAFRSARRATPGSASTGSSIMVIGLRGGPSSAWQRVSAAGQVWDDKPRWSPDGRRLYFVSTRGGPLNVWAADFDPETGTVIGAPVQMTAFDGPGEQILRDMREMELAVGERALIVPVQRPRGGIWILDRGDAEPQRTGR